MTDRKVEVEVSGNVTGLKEKLIEAGDAVSKFGDQTKTHLGAAGEVLSTLQTKFVAIGAVLAGGEVFAAAIAEHQKLTGEALHLARALDITAAEASILNIALGDIYSDSDSYIATFQHFTRMLKTNEEGLKAMGLKTRDANGDLRNANDLFSESFQVMGKYKAGIDQNLAAQTLYGRSVDEAMKFQKLNNQVMEEAKVKARSLGLVMTEEGVAATKEYKGAMNDVGDILSGVKNTIGQAVMPVLSELASWFNSVGPNVVVGFKYAIGSLISLFWGLRLSVIIVFETINAAVIQVVEPIRALGAAFWKAIHGDFAGAKAELTNIPKVWSHAWETSFDNIGNAAKATKKKLDALFGGGKAAGKVGKGGTEHFNGKDKGGKDTKDQSRMSEWDLELERQKLAHDKLNAENGTFYEFSKAAEDKYWRDLLQRNDLSKAEQLAIEKKAISLELAMNKDRYEQLLATYKQAEEAVGHNFEAKLAYVQAETALVREKFGAESKEAIEAATKEKSVAKELAAQKQGLLEEQMASYRAAKSEEIAIAVRAAELQFEQGLITNQRLLELKRGFAQDQFNLDLQAANDRIAVLKDDPTADPIELARRQEALLEIKRRFNAQLADLNKQSLMDSSQIWTNLTDRMSSLWDKGMQSLMNGTLTWRNAFKAIGAELVSWFAVQVVGKQVKDWALGQARMLAVKLGFIAQEKVVTTASSAVTIATKEGETAAVTAGNAAQAGTGAAASQASIPFIGPVLALAAMASIFAAVSSLGKRKSAFGGYDIPRGLNPLVQTHEEEMILPKGPSNTLRSLENLPDVLAQTQALLAAGGSASGDTHHWHVNAIDAKSFENFAQSNARVFAGAVKAAARDGFK